MKIAPRLVHSSHKHLSALNLKKCSWRSYSVSLNPPSLKKTILNVLKANLQEREEIKAHLESLNKQKHHLKILQKNPTQTFERLLEKIKKDIPEELLKQSDNIDLTNYLPHDLTDESDRSSPEWKKFFDLFLFVSTLNLLKNPTRIIQYAQNRLDHLRKLKQEFQTQRQELERSIYYYSSKCPLTEDEIATLIQSIENHLNQELKKTGILKPSSTSVDVSVEHKNDLMSQILSMISSLDM